MLFFRLHKTMNKKIARHFLFPISHHFVLDKWKNTIINEYFQGSISEFI